MSVRSLPPCGGGPGRGVAANSEDAASPLSLTLPHKGGGNMQSEPHILGFTRITQFFFASPAFFTASAFCTESCSNIFLNSASGRKRATAFSFSVAAL